MKHAAVFAAFALAFAPVASFAQGSPPNAPAPAAPVAAPGAPAAIPAGELVDPATGRSVTRDGTPGATPSSGETPSGEPPIGMGRGEK